MFLSAEQKNLTVCGVYKITNTANGKFYIGSAKNIRRRWSQHKWDLKSKRHRARHFVNAWYVYGEDAFSFEILESGDFSKDELLALEQKYLDELRPWDPSIGYNQQIKADSRLGLKHRPETIEKFMGPKTKGHAINISKSQSFFTGDKLHNLMKLRALGWSSLKLAAYFGCNKGTVLRTLKGKQTAHWLNSDPLPKSQWKTGTFKPSLSDAQVNEVLRMEFEGVKTALIARHIGVKRHVVQQIFYGKSYKGAKLEFPSGVHY